MNNEQAVSADIQIDAFVKASHEIVEALGIPTCEDFYSEMKSRLPSCIEFHDLQSALSSYYDFSLGVVRKKRIDDYDKDVVLIFSP